MDQLERDLKVAEEQFENEVRAHLENMKKGIFPEESCKEINEAKKRLADLILEAEEDGKYTLYPYNFYFKNERGGFTTVFNETHDAWFEDFKTKKEALEYLNE